MKNQNSFSAMGISGNKHALDKFYRHKISKRYMQCVELHDWNITKQQSIKAQLNNKI